MQTMWKLFLSGKFFLSQKLFFLGFQVQLYLHLLFFKLGDTNTSVILCLKSFN